MLAIVEVEYLFEVLSHDVRQRKTQLPRGTSKLRFTMLSFSILLKKSSPLEILPVVEIDMNDMLFYLTNNGGEVKWSTIDR